MFGLSWGVVIGTGVARIPADGASLFAQPVLISRARETTGYKLDHGNDPHTGEILARWISGLTFGYFGGWENVDSSADAIRANGLTFYNIYVYWITHGGIIIDSVLPRVFYFALASGLGVSAIVIFFYPIGGALLWWAALAMAYIIVRVRRGDSTNPNQQSQHSRTTVKVEWSSITGIRMKGRRARISTAAKVYQMRFKKDTVNEFVNLFESKTGIKMKNAG